MAQKAAAYHQAFEDPRDLWHCIFWLLYSCVHLFLQVFSLNLQTHCQPAADCQASPHGGALVVPLVTFLGKG